MMADRGAMIGRIEHARFGISRLGKGYGQKEVDDFLDGVVATLSGGKVPDPVMLRNTTFTNTWLRPGYRISNVRDLLEEIARYSRSRRPEDKGMAVDREAMISRIKHARFGISRLGKGYDEKEVDDFLDDIVGTLGDGRFPDPATLRNATFTVAWLRPGYRMGDVRGLL